MSNDDLDDAQELIFQTFNDFSLKESEASAVLGVVLAKICLSDPTKSIAFYTSFMGSFSQTIKKNSKGTDENTRD